MTGPDDPTDEPTDEPAKPAAVAPADNVAARTIAIVFAAPGSADMSIIPGNGVTPQQLYAAAYLMDLMAHEVRNGQLMQAAQTKLTVARGLPDLRTKFGRRQ